MHPAFNPKTIHKMRIPLVKMLSAAWLAVSVLSSAAAADTPYNHPMKQVFRAAVSGQEELSRLLAAGISVDAADSDGETALMKAADKGNAMAVKLLVAAGANVNAKDEDGETALMMAADEGRTEVVRLLLAAGAELNLRNDDGETALHKALDENHVDTANALREAGAK